MKSMTELFGIKKGIGGLSDNAISFVVVAVTIGIGATILATIQDSQVANSTAYNASEAGLQSLGTFSDNLGTLALVVIFGVILFFLGRFLVNQRGA